MKSVVFLTVLILSISGIVNAGLDTSNCLCTLITVFRFESTQFDLENEITYTVGAAPQEHQGSLLNGATLANNGKYGKCLHLQDDDAFGSATTIVPTLANAEFSIAAWVKLPRQTQGTLFFIMSGYDRELGASSNYAVFRIKNDGNLVGMHVIGETRIITETDDQNVSDSEWHHIVYTKYLDTYYLCVDGEVIAEKFESINPLLRIFTGDVTSNSIGAFQGTLTGNVYVDDFVVLSIGLSPYEVEGLYEDGIITFMEAMSVSPEGRITTTWAEIKSQR